MGKQIQIVGANNAPYVAKELDLESGNQFTFAKPDGTDVVEVGALDFIKAVEEYDTFKDWVVNYKRDENTIIPLRIDKIEGNVDTEKIVYTFTNDDVDVSSITLVKLIVEMVNATNEISASYVDETKEIEAGTVLPTPSSDDNGKVLGVEDGAYALVEQSGGGSGLPVLDLTNSGSDSTYVKDLINAIPLSNWQGSFYGKVKYQQDAGGHISYYETDVVNIRITNFGIYQVYFASLTYNLILRGKTITIANLEQDTTTLYDFFENSSNGQQLIGVPKVPSDLSSTTAVLKAINGVLTWVGE